MRLKAFRGKTTIPDATLQESVPLLAFEFALYRMRMTDDDTRDILSDYLKEIGA